MVDCVMHSKLGAFVALSWLLITASAQAQVVAASLPFVNDNAKTRIEKEYVASQKEHKALAITETGGWGIVTGKESLDVAVAGALSRCQQSNPRHPCIIAAENDQFVFPAKYTPEAVDTRAVELLLRAKLSMESYFNEDRDDGIAPTDSRRTSNFHAPTPTRVPGAKTIKTRELVDLLTNSKPVLINVLDWKEGSFAIPGTIWMQGLGKDRLYRLDIEQVEALFAKLAPERNTPLVFYCLSWECWLSYNASLRALDLGYTNVIWYRGGIESWNQANLPIVRTKLYKQF